jgi:hypothetical protein
MPIHKVLVNIAQLQKQKNLCFCSILINLQLFIRNIKLSKSKGFSDTAAGRYSLALYELASEANVLSDVEDHS